MATSNFLYQENFDLWAVDFSIPVYPLDERGEEMTDKDPVDYFTDNYAVEEAEKKINEANKQLKFYRLSLRDGYYAGTQIEVNGDDAPDEWWIDSKYFDFNEYGVNRYILRRMLKAEQRRINEKILPLFKSIGFEKYGISARFSNGETWYSKIA